MLRQSETSFRSFDSALPTVVFFTATQKTNATKKTMSVYSTKPCPSVSATNLLKAFTLRPLAPLPTGSIPVEEVSSWSQGNRRATVLLDADDVFWRRMANKVPTSPCRDPFTFCHTRQDGGASADMGGNNFHTRGDFPLALLTGKNERKSSPLLRALCISCRRHSPDLHAMPQDRNPVVYSCTGLGLDSAYRRAI